MKLSGELLKHVAARCKDRNFEEDKWDAVDKAIVSVRLTLEMLGCKAELGTEHDKDRQAAVEALLPMMQAGAPINFYRDHIVDSGLGPAMAAKPKAKASKLASA